MKKGHPLSRRNFLVGSGGALFGLPLLDVAFNSRKARADHAGVPHRLVIFAHQEGTVINRGYGATPERNDWSPSGPDGNLVLQPVLQPMNAFANRASYFTGLWNGVPAGHDACSRALLTGTYNRDLDLPRNASLDQVVADHIASQVSLQRRVLNLALADTNDGTFYRETQILWDAGVNIVPALVNPFTVFSQLNPLFQSGSMPPPMTLENRVRGQRRSILDRVRRELGAVRAGLPAEDRLRLDQHAAYIQQLEAELASLPPPTPAACAPVSIDVPSGWTDDHDAFEPEAADAMIDMAVMALACDVTRVVTIHFENMQDPSFRGEGVIKPLTVNGTLIENWHGMVHDARTTDDGFANLMRGFRFYTKKFTRLLERMDAIMEPNGLSLLDNSLVLWVSEFGDGTMHYSGYMPTVLAGTLGGTVTQGHHRVFPDEPLQPWTADPDVTLGTKTGQLYTAIQNRFGITGNFAGRAEYTPMDL